MWVHYNAGILIQGRTKHAEPKASGDEEVDPEEAMKKEVAKDPWDARLKQVGTDTKTKGGLPAWIIRSYENEEFVNSGKVVNYGTVVVKSLWWPGSFNFYNNGRVQQIYVGDGQKNEPAGRSFFPINPPKMVDDLPEKKCYDEPNPTEAWLAAKAKAEAQKNAAKDE